MLSVILAIGVLSFLLALLSLWRLHRKKETETVKKELSKGRVVFQSESSSVD